MRPDSAVPSPPDHSDARFGQDRGHPAASASRERAEAGKLPFIVDQAGKEGIDVGIELRQAAAIVEDGPMGQEIGQHASGDRLRMKMNAE